MTTAKDLTREQLLNTAANHLNRKYSPQREAMLISAGIPTERTALEAWLSKETDALADAKGPVVYYTCTVRVKNGADAKLPARNGIGCRIMRLELSAWIDRESSDMRRRDVTWVVANGNPWIGMIGRGTLEAPKNADPLEVARISQRRMLERGDCFLTRDEAVAAVTKMLHNRTHCRPS